MYELGETFLYTETLIANAVGWLKLFVEVLGAVIIGVGVLVTTASILRALPRTGGSDFNQIRLTLARYLALALEFQLGADILSTAIAPTWNQIGKLGVIAIIRTGLNFFLMREVHQEQLKRPTE